MTATYPTRTTLRPCRLYRFYVEDPSTGKTVLGYIGETGRQPFERLLEHLATQPWFDTVVRWEVDPQVFYGKDAVLRAETAAIRAERPLYNVKANEQNRDRIIPTDAIRQRRARDAANGDNHWIHPNDRSPQPGVDRGTPVRQRPVASPPKRPWTPAKKRTVGWGTTWLVLTIAGWVTGLVHGWGGWSATLASSAIAAGLLVGLVARWTFLGFPCSEKAWRAAVRRARRRRSR